LVASIWFEDSHPAVAVQRLEAPKGSNFPGFGIHHRKIANQIGALKSPAQGQVTGVFHRFTKFRWVNDGIRAQRIESRRVIFANEKRIDSMGIGAEKPISFTSREGSQGND
jgi:hypothetical protein